MKSDPLKSQKDFLSLGKVLTRICANATKLWLIWRVMRPKKEREKGNNIQQIPRRETAVSICQRSLKPRPSITRERLLENKNSATASTVNWQTQNLHVICTPKTINQILIYDLLIYIHASGLIPHSVRVL